MISRPWNIINIRLLEYCLCLPPQSVAFSLKYHWKGSFGLIQDWNYMRMNPQTLRTPHVAAFLTVIITETIFQETFHWNVFWPRDLDLWPMKLTFNLGLDILTLDLHAGIQICMSVRLGARVVTNRHTYTDDVKTISIGKSQTWSVIKKFQHKIIILLETGPNKNPCIISCGSCLKYCAAIRFSILKYTYHQDYYWML